MALAWRVARLHATVTSSVEGRGAPGTSKARARSSSGARGGTPLCPSRAGTTAEPPGCVPGATRPCDAAAGAHTSLAAAALPAPGAAPLGVLQVMRSPPHGAPPRPFSAEVRGALRVLAVCAASSLRKAVADMPGQALAARTLPGPTPGHEQTPSPAPAPPLAAARGPHGGGDDDDDGDSDDGRVNVRTVATRLDDLQRKVEADKEPDASAVALREVAERQTAVVATLIQAWRRGALMADGPHGAAAPDGAAPFGARRPWSALSQPEWAGQPAPQLAPDGRRAALLRRRAQIVARLEAIERLQRTRSAAEARQSIRALTDPLPSAA